ncbi:MAG: YfiR/HmsC family protein [Desulfobulbaceae bacterium]|nr:YfiR/HmsC family protein [Desulfobulbaceae bacterium]
MGFNNKILLFSFCGLFILFTQKIYAAQTSADDDRLDTLLSMSLVELEADWRITETLHAHGSFSYQHPKNKNNSETTPFAPEMVLYANLHWQFPPAWFLDGQYYWIAGRERAPADIRDDIKDNDIVNLTLRRTNIGPYHEGMDLSDCCLLFISSTELKNLPRILNGLENKPILTVADSNAFIIEGVMITLVTHKNKVRWAINRKPVKKAGLRLNAKLLDIAVEVIN